MPKLVGRLLLLLLLAAAGYAGWVFRHELRGLYEEHVLARNETPTGPDPETYNVLSDSLEAHRLRLRTEYQDAATEADRTAVVAQARKLLEGSLPRLMRCWLGTPWDFNGTAHEPGAGKVACGYFVSSGTRR